MDSFKQLQNIFKGDRIIWIIFFLLCIISVLEVYSSSSILGYKSGNYWFAAFYHTLLLGFGLVAMVCVLNVPCRYFKVMTPIMVPFSILLLILVYLIGSKENDAARWIKLFGIIPLQPSEIAKGTMVLATAHILSQLQTPNGAHPKAFKYVMLTSGVLIALVLPENFSTAALMGVVVFLMMIIGRVPLKQLGYLCSAVAIIGVVAIMLVWAVGKSKTELDGALPAEKQMTEMVDKQQSVDEAQPQKEEKAEPVKRGGVLHRLDLWKQRIDDFMNKKEVPPHEYDLDKNGQVGHANIAIASSHFTGVGPGNSVQRDFLPLAFSDFIYAIIFEELGWFGAAFVALLYISLLFRTGYIARRCQNTFPAYLAMGLAILIVVQAMFNMCVAVGLAPVTGQPLPLISKGGTSSIINCIYIGVILSISRTAKKREETAYN
ncbi:MAG: FtsW/RodA/SpoVE family cell cycle protein [Prevotella sp.]|jgi:cell division protein FtsW|nr:FtsW/RodA/SpoVE family cell cycle protein [Prevotella sp.]MBO6099177.1 FtsW/RodA/SpoVE family cell cycle protein [Prevotella sp.]MBO6234656.1 FtsW/RodA/SpoVE family cell cycle protein [Prevotella sp.]MBP3750236.1 FtsW/RodA/SpoVE family cell cycle protein [Prevotella sp.]MBQ1649761.1 FtsW/RodA/SpoVE family cell cycle protein [Prevotella sp.]